MSNSAILRNDQLSELRRDCLSACEHHPSIHTQLGLAHISVTGGTGFLGTWLAEMAAALNDEYDLKITLDLYARNTSEWKSKYPHLSERGDIKLFTQDVRSPFEFQSPTNFVIHAAGIPNNRVHASDPLRVMQTTIDGIRNTLDAAAKLDNLTRFLNISSGLVNGQPKQAGPLSEEEYYAIPSGKAHLAYVDAKRSAESMVAIYRSQLRMPISTLRPFTFAGPYQSLNRPWALNNFLGDALVNRDLKIYGDGTNRRSYLYGSDAAWWTMATLVKGVDGGCYNLGSPMAISHLDLAKLVVQCIKSESKISINTTPILEGRCDDFYPDITNSINSLGITQTCDLTQMIDKTWRWLSRKNHI